MLWPVGRDNNEEDSLRTYLLRVLLKAELLQDCFFFKFLIHFCFTCPSPRETSHTVTLRSIKPLHSGCQSAIRQATSSQDT